MKLSAYDGQQWRIERLDKTARLACAILSCSRDQLEALIDELRDQRGALVIFWRHDWTKHQETAFETAWRECGESVVAHSFNGRTVVEQ